MTTDHAIAGQEPQSRIVPADHPLAGVFSVGPDAKAAVRRAAAQVVGLAIGERVECRFRSHLGHAATVVRINPADREVGVTLAKLPSQILWCTPSELKRASDNAYKAPRSRATLRNGETHTNRPTAA